MIAARVIATAGLIVALAAPVFALPAAEVRARVDHHLRHVERLAGRFEALLAQACPRFPTPADWDAYVDAEADHLVLLLAHLEQAWLEAKRTGDDEIRRAAKAPRRQREQARALVDKLGACAERNGSTFSPLALWRRVEREVPRRQAEIALPQ